MLGVYLWHIPPYILRKNYLSDEYGKEIRKKKKMGEDYKIMVLSSNVDAVDEFPHNSRSSFKVPMQSGLSFSSDWEVCLKEIYIPNYIFNVKTRMNTLTIVSVNPRGDRLRGVINGNRSVEGKLNFYARKGEDGAAATLKDSSLNAKWKRIVPTTKVKKDYDLSSTSSLNARWRHIVHIPESAYDSPDDEEEYEEKVALRTKILASNYVSWTVHMPEGRYTPSSFCHTFNKEAEKASKEVFKSLLSYNVETKKIMMHLEAGDMIKVQSTRLRYMMGFTMGRGNWYGNMTHLEPLTMSMPYPAQFLANLNQAVVYCNLVGKSIMGTSLCNYLRIVDISDQHDSGEVMHRNYTDQQYYHACNAHVPYVHIEIRDMTGEEITIDEGIVTVLLHIRKKARRILQM